MGLPTRETFFAANFIVIYFGCGLIFLLMGFGAAVAARTFRDSHLALVQGLPLLAAFGLLGGVAQWGVIFIPLQAAYLGVPALTGLLLLQTVAMAMAYACLLAFGARLTAAATAERWAPALTWLPLAGSLAWLGWFLAAAPGLRPGPELAEWRLARLRAATYLLALPGAVLSAWGVLGQRRDMARYYPRAAWFLSGTAVAFLLLVPLSPRSIPAVPVYELVTPQLAHFSTVWGVPVQVFLGLDGLMLAFFTMQALEVFRRENSRRLEESERRQAVLEERHRIGRELNDEVMQDVLGLGMVLESVQAALGAGGPGENLRQVRLQLGRIADRLRAYILELEPVDWETRDLARGLRQLIEEFRAHTLIPVDLDLDPAAPVDPAAIRHLLVLAHEALANVRRHAAASRVHLRLAQAGSQVLLVIRDNGRGMPAGADGGPGLARMQTAAAAAGGQLLVLQAPGGGTEVRLLLPGRPAG